ncbi:MAG: nucleotide-binding universal stress UspA family protein [Gammaproteobacteria bacterium]|jgi:nucleotide-binding universal stress UspA family protein
MKKIIALVDGSVYSQSVCDHAAWSARQTGMAIEVVHVLGRRDVSSQPANLSGSIGLGARSALLEELAELDAQRAVLGQRRGRAILDDARARINDAGVADVSTRLRNGEIVETVDELEEEADLVVIGKRGEAADFDKLHLGSNLERVVRSSRRPVLVASRAFSPITKCLIAFDGGPSALKAIEHLANTRALAEVDCQLLTVGVAPKGSMKRLEEAAVRLRAADYKVETQVVGGQADVVIAQKVENEGFGLLVMGAYGHSRIRHLIIGSTTTQMVRSCKIPILLFRGG